MSRGNFSPPRHRDTDPIQFIGVGSKPQAFLTTKARSTQGQLIDGHPLRPLFTSASSAIKMARRSMPEVRVFVSSWLKGWRSSRGGAETRSNLGRSTSPRPFFTTESRRHRADLIHRRWVQSQGIFNHEGTKHTEPIPGRWLATATRSRSQPPDCFLDSWLQAQSGLADALCLCVFVVKNALVGD